VETLARRLGAKMISAILEAMRNMTVYVLAMVFSSAVAEGACLRAEVSYERNKTKVYRTILRRDFTAARIEEKGASNEYTTVTLVIWPDFWVTDTRSNGVRHRRENPIDPTVAPLFSEVPELQFGNERGFLGRGRDLGTT